MRKPENSLVRVVKEIKNEYEGWERVKRFTKFVNRTIILNLYETISILYYTNESSLTV